MFMRFVIGKDKHPPKTGVFFWGGGIRGCYQYLGVISLSKFRFGFIGTEDRVTFRRYFSPYDLR